MTTLTVRIQQFSTDFRSAELRNRYERVLEKFWRRRVAMNPKERQRLAKAAVQTSAQLPSLLRRQAE